MATKLSVALPIALGLIVAQGLGHAAAPAPAFTLPALSGPAVSLAQLRGTIVLVDFWATWCVPCRTEMPWLLELQKTFGLAFPVLLGNDHYPHRPARHAGEPHRWPLRPRTDAPRNSSAARPAVTKFVTVSHEHGGRVPVSDVLAALAAK